MTNSRIQNTGWGWVGWETAGPGARGHASEFPGSKQSQTTYYPVEYPYYPVVYPFYPVEYPYYPVVYPYYPV